MEAHYGAIRSVLEQIEEVRDKWPESTALVMGERRLSFDHLLSAANQFSRQLRRQGISENQTVALCLERSFDWIAAALGILHAGAAYVPLDLAWPAARLRFAIEDSGAKALVAHKEFAEELGISIPLFRPELDLDSSIIGGDTTPSKASSGSLAYVIYTSGSSGTPKGVEITHANLANLVNWYKTKFDITREDRASHLMGLGFDATVLEIWGHLCAGASLHFADESIRSSPKLIQSWMVKEQITIGVVPAVIGQSLVTMAWPADSSLRLLTIGGDSLHHGPNADIPFVVVNQYGPTECTVVSTFAVLDPQDKGTPPIGRPIKGSTIYLLDEQGKPVEEGSPAEVYIGGAGVGRGYRNLPEMTEKCFLADPFSSSSEARMYRTGDRAVRRADGSLEFRGRIDRQIKVRGHRVELDEVGTALMRHSSVTFATATFHALDGQADPQLIGYVLYSGPVDRLTAEELQEHLLKLVPDHMVPSLFVRLEALPISTNGKLDLKLLPLPDSKNEMRAISLKKPINEIENRLLGMIHDLFGNDTVRASDNFFLSGGHSLLGMQFLMRLREAFGVDLTLRQLLEAPTVERLAVKVEAILIDSIESMSDENAEAFVTE
jgi:amino acid adenylation domain-containing protein